mmetsp:Transcript_7847/g.19481  ORF Transcript_7847/g.19481 Transcript_7847/m.19481 type:complete len:94 (-) Transcript_7847:1345-1626(-)
MVDTDGAVVKLTDLLDELRSNAIEKVQDLVVFHRKDIDCTMNELRSALVKILEVHVDLLKSACVSDSADGAVLRQPLTLRDVRDSFDLVFDNA